MTDQCITECYKLICSFNQHPNTIFLQKLLDFRECCQEVIVPKQFQHYLRSPTDLTAHLALTKELVEFSMTRNIMVSESRPPIVSIFPIGN